MKINFINGSVTILGILFIVFFILKITNTINWSWWVVTLPLWIYPALMIGICVFFALLFLVAVIVLLLKKIISSQEQS